MRRRAKLEHPLLFGRSLAFTSGGSIVSIARGVCTTIHRLGSRINAVWRAPSGALFFATSSGVLHVHRRGNWGSLDLKAGALMSVAGFDDHSLFCGDEAGFLYVIENERVTRKVQVTGELCVAVRAKTVWCGGLEGVFRLDGQKLVREGDACIASLRVFDGEVWAGGHQVGLSGTSEIYRRSRTGTWAAMSAPEFETESVFDLVRYRGRLFLANGRNGLICDENDHTTIERPEPCYRLEVIGERLIATGGTTTALIFDGKRWQSLGQRA